MKRMTDYFKKLPKTTETEKNERVDVDDIDDSVSSQPDPGPSSSTLTSITPTLEIGTRFSSSLGTKESGPIQRRLTSYPLTLSGKQNRSFLKAYFDQYPWLEYSVEKDAAFCYVCRVFSAIQSYSDESFTKTGFQNWKRLKEKLGKHEKCKIHLLCWEKYIMSEQSKKTGSVMAVLSSSYKQEIEKNNYYMNRIVEIITFLSSQGLALRGHDEKVDSDNRGNFLELCQFFARHDSLFKEGFEKITSFCSKMIQNEILEIMSTMLKEKILEEVRACGFFSIMIDEVRCYKEHQLSLCIRYVDNELTPHERFLMFKDCSNDRNAEELACILLSILEQLGISDLPVVAQSYDGASVMSGKHAGLQAKIREKYESAVYFHCHAHRVELAVTDMCKSVESSKLLFNGLQALYVHFAKPSNHCILQQAAEKLQVKKKSLEISSQSSTRWTCRYQNCEQLIKNFDIVTEALSFEFDQCEDTDSIEALGILKTITSPGFVVNLFIFHEVLTLTHVLSKQLQKEDATLGGASNVIKATIASLKEKRKDPQFLIIWEKITEFAEKYDICLENARSSKRKREMSTRLKDSAVLSTTIGQSYEEYNIEKNNANETMKFWQSHVYNRVLDTITQRLEQRFSEESLLLAEAVDSLFNFDFENSKPFLDHYGEILKINTTLLAAEMTIAKICLNKIEASEVKNKETTATTTEKKKKKDIAIVRKFKRVQKVVNLNEFPNLFKTLKLAASIPISSASCERSFSAMRRIKNWLRTTMTQDRFSNLSLLYIERNLYKNQLSSQDIVERFAIKPRKINLK